jgi:hypothetical protein
MPNQREVVEVFFRLPDDGRQEKHPVIVLSNNEINSQENGFVAIMMTSQVVYRGDEYSFELNDTMFNIPLSKPFSAVRLHLIGNFMDTDVIRNQFSNNYMKEEPFKRLLTHINGTTFKFKISID